MVYVFHMVALMATLFVTLKLRLSSTFQLADLLKWQP